MPCECSKELPIWGESDRQDFVVAVNLHFSQLGSGGRVKRLDFVVAIRSKYSPPVIRPCKGSDCTPPGYTGISDGDESVTIVTVEDANGVIPARGSDAFAVRGEFNSCDVIVMFEANQPLAGGDVPDDYFMVASSGGKPGGFR